MLFISPWHKFLTWLRELMKFAGHAQPRGRRSRVYVPHLSWLEDRLAPALIVVTTTADVVDAGDGATSLREAITAANLDTDPDTIVLAPGVYKITRSGAGEDLNLTGDFDIANPLKIMGASAASTVIEGGKLDRVLDVLGPASGGFEVAFEDVTIRGGFSHGDGGGIRVSDDSGATTFSNLTLVRSVVSGNTAAGSGGGISNQRGDLTLLNSHVTKNHATGLYSLGGGIHASGDVTLVASSVRGNTARSNGGGIATNTYMCQDVGDISLVASTVSGNTSRKGSGGGISTGYNCIGGSYTGGGGDATVTDSTVSGNTAGGSGGGIDVAGAVTLTDSIVHSNTAGLYGGGIRAGLYGPITLAATIVSGNTARHGSGGGIYGLFDVTLTDSTVRGNTAYYSGGGITASGNVTLTASTVRGNTARFDGGGIHAGYALTLTASTISGNRAGNDGGGIFAYTNFLTIERSTISGNRAGDDGGGIALTLIVEAARLTNVTFSHNSAGDNGGGLFLDVDSNYSIGTATLLNVTITRNIASDGGGIFNKNGVVEVKNSIIAQNSKHVVDDHRTAPGVGPDLNGKFVSLGHNLIGIRKGSSGFMDGLDGDQVGAAAAPIDPRLGPLAHNGGPTRTHKLLAGSPAIDAGEDFLAPGTDQRGVSRPLGPHVDIGAFEMG